MAIKIIVDPVKGLYQESTNEGASFNVLAGVTTTGISGGGGGASFFSETGLNSIATTGSVAMTYLSASTGGEITGSFTNGSNSVVASGEYSHAQGDQTTASGLDSHAEGGATTASGPGSHSEGVFTLASGIIAHAEGAFTQATGNGAHSEGYQTIASGEYSHAEGESTFAFGIGSHAEGWGSETIGTASFAAGLYTIASGSIDGANPPTTTQAVFGKYNLRDNASSLFVIGDGLDDLNRRDVLRVNSGSVQVTGSFIAPNITGSLSGTIAGNPFIIAGSNITTNYNSLGQWEITGSGGSIPINSWIDFMTQRSVTTTEFVGDYTIGFSFFTTTSGSLTGYRLKWDGTASPVVLSIKLWSAGSEIASTTQTVQAAGTYAGNMTTPVSLDPYKEYYFSYRDVSGVHHYVIFNTSQLYRFAGFDSAGQRSIRVRPDIIINAFYAYGSGDIQPNTVGGGDNCSNLEPVISG